MGVAYKQQKGLKMFKAFLIKYAEIGIKGKNRYLFEDALVSQIRFSLKKVDGEFKVYRTQGRIYVDALSSYDYDEVIQRMKELDLFDKLSKFKGDKKFSLKIKLFLLNPKLYYKMWFKFKNSID